ncbi:RNA methyltransferase [Acaricomes phytoseiuli]|uniref:TrmH family RNA methyltransferase n=1 Tax=Acaricomes phytoseiuli TaxID=291968 RepID=UPI0012E9AC82|nr:RNA methyltransferase [Acaricomes phytoseiuli]MCW1248833.1 RNA methyltransferase [Acaricomes phytoseiuli]
MSNPRSDRVRDLAKLAKRSVRSRREEFLVEGPQAVREVLKAHHDARSAGKPALLREVYASADCLERFPEIAELSAASGALVHLADDAVLAALADTVTPQGVVAVCRFLDVPLEAVFADSPRLLAVLCRVQDPGNAGTILRAADAAGADAVVFTSGSVDAYNPKTVRSTAGSLFHVPVVLNADLDELAGLCQSRGITVLAADGYGAENLDELQDQAAIRRLAAAGEPWSALDASPARLELATTWLFGNEAQGLCTAELDLADSRVAVPIYGAAESLNVGTAATVCLYASARAQQPVDRTGEEPLTS